MKMAWFQGSPTGPIGGSVTLPPHPPVTGTPVAGIGNPWRIGLFEGLIPDGLASSAASWSKAIGYGAGSAASLIGAGIFPSNLGFVTPVAKLGLLGLGGYLAYRAGVIIKNAIDESRYEETWKANLVRSNPDVSNRISNDMYDVFTQAGYIATRTAENVIMVVESEGFLRASQGVKNMPDSAYQRMRDLLQMIYLPVDEGGLRVIPSYTDQYPDPRLALEDNAQ